MKDYIDFANDTMFPYILYNRFFDITSITGISTSELSVDEVKMHIKSASSLYPSYELTSTNDRLSTPNYSKYKAHLVNYIQSISSILQDDNYNLSNISLFKEYVQSIDTYNIPYAYINFFKHVCKNSYLFAYTLLTANFTNAGNSTITDPFTSSSTFNTSVNTYIANLERFLLNDLEVVSKNTFDAFMRSLFVMMNAEADPANMYDISLNSITEISSSKKNKYLLFTSLLPFMHLMYYYRRIPGKEIKNTDFSDRTLENKRISAGMIYNNCIYTLYTIYDLINKHIPYISTKHLFSDNLAFMMTEIASHSITNSLQGTVTNESLKSEVQNSQKVKSKINILLQDINLMRSKMVNYINSRDTINKHAKTYRVLYWISLSFLLVYALITTVFFFLKKQGISKIMNMVNIGVMIVVLILFIVSIF